MLGTTISHYEVVEKLGEGGMGQVYRARDPVLERTVALKVLPPDHLNDPERRRRFLREARAVSALAHSNIITIYDLVSHQGSDCLVMEYVEGRPLSEIIPAGGLPPDRALGYAREIAGAIGAAHGAGIIHRDLKPANVMVTPDDRVKVLDFGLAKRDAGEEPTSSAGTAAAPLTRFGAVLGTLEYMSPEQALGQVADARSDVFSLGAVLYEMLTGQRPFSGTSAASLLHAVAYEEPRSPLEIRGELPPELERIVTKALAKNPADRFQTMEELAAALAEPQAVAHALQEAPTLADELSPAAPPRPAGSALDPIRAAVARRRWPIVGAVAGVLLVAAALTLEAPRRWLRWDAGPERGVPADASAAPLAGLSPFELLERGDELLTRYDREGNVDLAIDRYSRAIDARSDYATAYAGLGRAYWRKYRVDDDPASLTAGLANARRAVELDPQLSAGRASLGLLLVESGATGEAGEAFESVLRLDPGNADALRGRAELAMLEGDLAAARADLESAVAAAPASWDLASRLGYALYQQGLYEEAEASYRRAVELSPDNHEARKTLAAALHMQGAFAEAAGELQKALAIRPEAGVYNNLGTLYFFQGLYQDAATAFERAVELSPNEYLRWANLADAYRAIPGREEAAGDAYLRAIQLLEQPLRDRPGDPLLRSRRALYLARRGDVADSLVELDGISASAPDDPALLYRLALAYEIAGHRERALAALGNALERGYSLVEVKGEPDLVDLRADVRYHRLALRFES